MTTKKQCPTCGCELYQEHGPCKGSELVEVLRAISDAYGCECVEGSPRAHCPMCQARALLAELES